MRAVVIMTALVLAGCATEKLALAPPAGVDLSGHWTLNEAESDDPQRLIQNQNNPIGIGAGPGQGSQSGGAGGRGGGRGRGGGEPGGGFGAGAGGGPTASPGMINALGEGLRWPGKELDVKQVAGVVAFTSGGRNRVFTPADADGKPQLGQRKSRASDRDDDDEELGPLRERGGEHGGEHGTAWPPGPNRVPTPPPGEASREPGVSGLPGPGAGHSRLEMPVSSCGWDGRTLVVQAGGAREDRGGYEQRFLLSDDGERLIEIVGRKGSRGEGFTLSRVWDRAALPGSAAIPAPTPESPAPRH